MEDQAHSFESLFGRAGDYFETRLKLLKLKSVEKSSDIVSSIVSVVALILIIFLSIIIVSIGLALWIGEFLGKSYYGFFVVGGIYIIIALIVYLFRKYLLKIPVGNLLIDKVLN